MTAADLSACAEQIKAQATALGFTLAAIASAQPSAHAAHFHRWLQEGMHADMAWMTRRVEQRLDVRQYFPGAQSVLCVAMNYNPQPPQPPQPPHAPSSAPWPDAPAPLAQSPHAPMPSVPTPPAQAPPAPSSHMPPTAAPSPHAPATEQPGLIARYARGEDYHQILTEKLRRLADWIKQRWPAALTRCAVDTAPLLERELAQRAGLGWIGKNCCLIHRRVGSWLLLGEIVLNLPLVPDTPQTDHCGTCRLCLDACPTGALVESRLLDARRCISYWTIESRTILPDELARPSGRWLFGCDICQEVCPWNRQAPPGGEPRLAERFSSLDLWQVVHWTQTDYFQATRHSPLRRVKLPVFHARAAQILQQSSLD